MFTCMSRDNILPEEAKAQRRQQAEIELFQFYKLENNVDFKVFDVEVKWNDKQYHVHTIEGGKKNSKITFVLLHGYGGSNVHYVKMYKELFKHVRVLSIDLPGMGYSSKENITISNFDDTIEFFVGILDLWRIEIDLKQFCLVGHSFGGYIAAYYASLHQQYIQKLYLLSPAGTTYLSEEQVKNQQDYSKEPWIKKKFIGYLQGVWDSQTTHLQLRQKWYGNYFMNRYLQKRMKLEGEEYKVWKKFTEEMISLPEGSEKALFLLFKFGRGLIAHLSIQEIIETKQLYKNIPIFFYYGDSDWMDSTGAVQLSQQYPGQVYHKIILNAGHQLNFENPQLTAQTILEDLKLKDSQKIYYMEEELGQMKFQQIQKFGNQMEEVKSQ